MLSRTNEIIRSVTEIHLAMRFADPPFSVREFSKYYPAFQFQASTDLPAGIDGQLVVQDGRNYVFFRKEQSHVRNRFTICHEVGHAFLHVEEEAFKCDAVEHRGRDYFLHRPIKEQEADFFAAELLVPLPMLDRFVLDDLNTVKEKEHQELVRVLAEKFMVSKPCMQLRLEDLNDIRRTTAGRGVYLKRA